MSMGGRLTSIRDYNTHFLDIVFTGYPLLFLIALNNYRGKMN